MVEGRGSVDGGTGPTGPELVLVLAVLTYRRNDALAALLPLLVDQCGELTRSSSGSPSAIASSVLVVDNDADRGAEPVAADAGPLVRSSTSRSPGSRPGAPGRWTKPLPPT